MPTVAEIRLGNKDIRSYNRINMLRLLFDEGALTQADIKKKLKLSGPTITQNIQEFMAKGLLQEGSEQESSGGRRPHLIEFCYNTWKEGKTTPVKQKEEKNMHIAIVEDDPATRAQLAEYIQRYTRQYGTTFQVDTFADGDEIAENYRPVYDILFMDIEMKHLDGMETARRIRQLDGEVLIIFITNTAQYAINGYSVGATDYMLKPVPYFCFSQQLKKAVGQLQKRARFDLTVTAEDGMRRLNTAEIYYIESDGHTVHFYTENGDFSASGLLKNFEEKLAGRPFARCNNCYLVNLAQVAGIAQEIVKVGPHSLPVSRTKRRAFLDAMSDYIDSASAV